MVQIDSPKAPPELSQPSLPQAVRFFNPKQKKILAASSVVFLVILVLSSLAFYFWLTSFKNSLVDFNISGPTQSFSGETVTFVVSYWNNTKQILQNASLTVRIPQDAVIDGGKTIQNFDLGSIGIGGGGKKTIEVALIGPDKSVQKLEAILSYKPQNTASNFENEASKEVAINGSALSVDLKVPEMVLPNTKNAYAIHYKNNTAQVFRNVSIEAIYPDGFSLASSDRATAKGDNTWELGDLNPAEEGNIAILGILKNTQSVNFEVAIGVIENGKFYKFSQSSSQIGLVAPPLEMDISVNNQSTSAVNPGENLQFKIHYRNGSGAALSDVVLKAALSGLMYDFSTLRTTGNFDGTDGTITWNGGNLADFRSLPPNASGDVEFQINVKSRYVMRTFRDKNFLLQVAAEMETPTVPSSLAVKSLSAASDISIKVNTKAELKTVGYYFDATLKNSGPLPPKVNQTTTYAVHWQLTNYSNDVDGVTVKAVLPEGVSWLDKKAGAGGATLEYNDRTNELTWNVGKLAAGTGVLLDTYEAIFQVGLTPSINKVNMVVPILGESTLTGKDAFTGNDILTTAPILKTDLPDDPGVGILKSRIQP
ncbi:MAG: hypothetical protein Q7S78_02300 [Candidatus Azambacteria bacterium]|nr:hypothetical protein [Candidatus Azambacteria bacterium]